MTTISGAELAKLAGSTDTVVKFGGRWYWVTEVEGPEKYGTSCGFAMVVAQARDPRMVQLGPGHYKMRVIYPDETYLTRARTAPVWDWVTRELAR